MAEIVLDHVTKVFADGTVAVDELDLHVTDGEFMVLVGPSGCGKTTALRMVAGLEQVSGGEIRIGGAVVNDLSPRERDIAMVFQNYALYPQMTVYQNMAFGLKLGHVGKDEIDRRVRESARTLGLEPLLDRKPRTLSGGQRQRVAMGRAIVRNPQAFLMDEPLSNLDAKLRLHMRVEIARLQQELAVTTLYVTHDQVEAMTMGDRVAVLRQGQLQQVGTPTELFDRPRNLFVGGFIGTPSMNLFRARLERHGDELRVGVGSQSITLDPQVLADRPALLAWADRDVAVGIRPHDFSVLADRAADAATLELCVDLVEELGTETLVHLDLEAPPLDTDEVRELTPDTDVLAARADAGRTDAVAAVRAGAGLRRGDTVRLAVDTRRMHFFDPDSGAGVYGA